MDSWNPKIDKFGRVVSGSGTIWFRQSYKESDGKSLGTGWSPAFLNDNSIIWNNGHNVSQYVISSGEFITKNEQYDTIVAANDKYIGRLVGIITFEGSQYDGDSISISKDGRNTAWITPYQSEVRNPIFNTGKTSYQAIISEISIGKSASIWSEDNRVRTKGTVFSEGIVKNYTVFTWEIGHICDVGSDSYIVSFTQNGLAIRLLGDNFGWYFEGIFDNPDSIYLNGLIVVVSSKSGNPKYIEIDPLSARIDLRKTQDGIDYVKPPDPIPIPIPPKPPIPEPEEKIKTARKYKMSDTKKVGLIMVDGKYIAFNPGLSFNNNDPQEFEMSQPDNLFQFKHSSGKVLGADATQYSQDVCKQLYLTNDRGAYESWNVEHPADNPDLISAFITFRRPEGINFSVKLRVVEL